LDQVTLLAAASEFITADVLASLHDSGGVDIYAPVSDYVPLSWRRPWFSHDFTTEQALSNLSGIGGALSLPTYLPIGGALCSYLPFGTLEGCARTIYDTQFSQLKPGKFGFYGGGQWHIAGAVAQRASGKTWDELVEELFVEPVSLAT